MAQVVKMNQPSGGIQIERDIPIPRTRWGGRPATYPWAELEIGESFAVPPDRKIASFIHRASMAGKAYGRVFTTRKQADGTYRCWRIA